MDSWSTRYEEAREKFQEAGRLAGGRLEVIRAGQEEVDVVILGDPLSSKLLLHTSGVHGVEGFAGSAIQIAAMKKEVNVCICLLHGINADGMRESRRWTKNNIDLNRNWISEDVENDIYDDLTGFLNPPEPDSALSFYSYAAYIILMYGFHRAKQGIAGGQSKYPNGLFYRGTEREPVLVAIEDFLRTTFPKIKKAVHLDVHTGLGPRGKQTLIVQTDNPDPPEAEIAEFLEIIPESNADPNAPRTSYRMKGGFTENALRSFIDDPTCIQAKIVQEFGTEGPLTVLRALRDELALLRHHHGKLPDPSHPIRKNLRAVFYPEDDLAWKSAVLEQGLTLFHSALAFLRQD